MQSAKNVAASAKAGMDKTKATMQEKAEKMTTRDPLQREMVTERKEERVQQAEGYKQQARAPTSATGAYGGDIQQGMGGQTDYPESGTGLGPGGVGATDPNVAGGARTGYGLGNTI